MNPKTLACILAYYPDANFSHVCAAIAKQCTFLLVIDNSPTESLRISNFTAPANALIVYNRNHGAVSGALNIGLSYARKHNFKYMQLYDQDTVPAVDITTGLINTLEQNPGIALVSPRFINLNTNHPGRVLVNVSKWKVKNTWPRTNVGLVDVLFAINSCSVINIETIPPDVHYDERLIIDGCDVDFCLELKKRGYDIMIDTAYCITHGIGNRKDGGGRWSPTNYSEQRKHLMAKNRIMVWRRYLKNYPGFVLNDILVFILDTGRTVFFEKQGLKKLWAIIRGVISGFKESKMTERVNNHDNYE